MSTGIKLRFKDTDTQLRAKEVLQQELGDTYVVAMDWVDGTDLATLLADRLV